MKTQYGGFSTKVYLHERSGLNVYINHYKYDICDVYLAKDHDLEKLMYVGDILPRDFEKSKFDDRADYAFDMIEKGDFVRKYIEKFGRVKRAYEDDFRAMGYTDAEIEAVLGVKLYDVA